MLMIDDYDAWWHFPLGLLRAVPTGIAIAILGPALVPRRIMLDAEKLRLSARGYTRTLRVARSIADLAGEASIRRQDVAEALAFRHRMPGRGI